MPTARRCTRTTTLLASATMKSSGTNASSHYPGEDGSTPMRSAGGGTNRRRFSLTSSACGSATEQDLQPPQAQVEVREAQLRRDQPDLRRGLGLSHLAHQRRQPGERLVQGGRHLVL